GRLQKWIIDANPRRGVSADWYEVHVWRRSRRLDRIRRIAGGNESGVDGPGANARGHVAEGQEFGGQIRVLQAVPLDDDPGRDLGPAARRADADMTSAEIGNGSNRTAREDMEDVDVQDSNATDTHAAALLALRRLLIRQL